MATVILHDQRLLGQVEPGLGRVIKVDENTLLNDAFHKVKTAAESSDTELVIACHGYTTHSYDEMSNIRARGGFGLQLCRESLRGDNVSSVATLSGYFSKIWLMACAPAGTMVHSSRPFCRDFAGYAEAPVIASDTNQRYRLGLTDHAATVSRQVLRFGQWEGNVYQFNTDGTVVRIGNSVTPLP